MGPSRDGIIGASAECRIFRRRDDDIVLVMLDF
jgi:hypothetical protein